jgi:magnesium transporter
MLYLSALIGRRIKARGGSTVARLTDVITSLEVPATSEDNNDKVPAVLLVKGLVARTGPLGKPLFVPASLVSSLDAQGVRLHISRLDLHPFERRDGDLLLTKDLWDKQIIDLKSRRVVRVNDIILDNKSGKQDAGWHVSGVDIALGALLRRVKLAWALEALIRRPVGAQVIEWADMDLFASNVPGSMRVEHAKLATLHPVEIARLTDAVSYHQGAEIIASLHDTLAADTLEEIAAERQTDIVDQIPEEHAADIIEEMAPDAATDLISELPEKKASALLEEMNEERAADVRQLLRYPDHTAGRAMTTDFVCVRPNMTVGEVVEANKPRFLSADLIYYMYVTASEEDDKLVGVITVRDLLVQSQDTPVSDFMLTTFLAVRAGEHERAVARKMAEYNLLALPVVDRNGNLLGVVTIDDALDSLLPEGWKKHLPRIFN